MLDFTVFLKNLKERFFGRRRMNVVLNTPVTLADPFKRLTRQATIIGASLLIVTSIAPSHVLETGFTADFLEEGTDYLEEGEELPLPPFLINEEGFVLKSSPVSEEVSRIGLTDSVKHTVVSGDTLSTIAALYGINVQTLVWENNIAENSTLKIGQTLVIPAVDGVSHAVTNKTETLASIAKTYGVEVPLIKEHNNLQDDVIQKGQKLFIPGGKRKEPVIARAGVRGAPRSSANTFDTKIVMSSNDAPREGRSLIFPTNGKITQGFWGRHYALDIGNSSKPDVWAAGEGTVVKSSGGCLPREVRSDKNCGHGYGNHVVVDHGNGIQTLYAHLETIYLVEGQSVSSGQSLGKMGNTGRVYGATGIHLHFEVFDRGVKRNPGNYF